MKAREIIDLNNGIVATRNHMTIKSQWSELVKDGLLLRPLPGVVMDPGLEDDPRAWIRAVQLWNPNAVVAGRAAAALTFEPDLEFREVCVYTGIRRNRRGPLRFRHHELENKHVEYVGNLRVTNWAATALTAGLESDYRPATTALRKELVTHTALCELANAWQPSRRARAREVTKALGKEPWSVAEVDAHALFRTIGAYGWVGNHEVLIEGKSYFIDIAFPGLKMGFEINSFQFHSSKEAMERDASRLNNLVADGWQMFSLTPRQIRDQPEETAAFVTARLGKRQLRGAQTLSRTSEETPWKNGQSKRFLGEVPSRKPIALSKIPRTPN